MAWISLFFAGLFEICWAVGLKYSENFTRLWPSVWTIGTMMISFFLLSYSLKTLPLGTAYAVWTGIGAVGTVIFGILYFHDSSNFIRLLCIAFIVLGIIGLKVSSTH